ncbi:unnamed protein product [Allacma fusca]|uniref:ceramidase n=1 Tax=Allacma fusca TaxID=39272 RepID=A0A8J2JZ33_9HEXA|nr:unnamed protein product [Allacma fusca]
MEFLELKKNTGKEENRARDLFYALWIPDLFMKRVEQNADWSLMCPHDAPGLFAVWGEEFEDLYIRYEKEGRALLTWCNLKSNQKNLGTIKCSNLCTEVVQYSSSDEVAVCNLASIAVIDVNYYPVPEVEVSNKRHRPIGIGIQGLADAFLLMRYPFESEQAKLLNIQIFETIFMILQYDMWNVTPTDLWNWNNLKGRIAEHGLRNSLFLAPMPTASTAQILGNNEAIEAYTSNIYTRRVLSGEFQVVNPHLLKDLTELGLWNSDMKNKLIAGNGSVQHIKEIPQDLKALYKTVWEISQKCVLDMSADRGAYIDQSQSLNIHIAEPTFAKLTSMHFYTWKKGLKTGMYYLRTKPAANAIQFTVDKSKLQNHEDTTAVPIYTTLDSGLQKFRRQLSVMPPLPEQFWGPPTSTLDWCEVNYEASPFVAEFWNTISNLGMILPPLFGIYEVLRLGLEKKFVLTHTFLIVVGLGSWAFHMTLLWPMQLADELPMVWGNSILVYQLWEIRKTARRQINWAVIVVCFTYCFFFTALYLIFKNPLIHHTMYGLLVIVVLGMDLRLVNYNQCRTCTKLLSVGFFMYTFGFGLWNIDNQLCPQITELRAQLPRSLRPFTQLHAWWHILAGYATYLHILFGIHARGHFFKPKTRITVRYQDLMGSICYTLRGLVIQMLQITIYKSFLLKTNYDAVIHGPEILAYRVLFRVKSFATTAGGEVAGDDLRTIDNCAL